MDVRSFRGRSRRANGWHGRRPPSPSCSALILLFLPRIALRILRLQTVPEHPEAVAEARATMAGFYLGLGLSLHPAGPALALHGARLLLAVHRLRPHRVDAVGPRQHALQLDFAGHRTGARGLAAGLLRSASCHDSRQRRASSAAATKLSETMRDSVLRSSKACARRQSTFDRGTRRRVRSGPQKSIRSKI